jgi:hypothetical protein
MKKEKLKILIKEVLKEMYGRRNASSSTYENYDIEFESLVIPGISTEDDSVEVSVSIGYDAEAGYEARGMFGPPEQSSPGEGASVDIVNYWPTSVRVKSKLGEEKEYDPNKFTTDQQTVLKNAVEEHMDQNDEKIRDMILNTIDFDSEPDYADVD